MMGSSPNNGVVSPNVASNIVASFGNQALNDNDNTSDNTGSSPNNGIVSPNIDYDPGTSSIEHGVEAAKNKPDVAGSSPNSNLFSPKRMVKTILGIDLQMFISIVQFSILRFEFSILNLEQVNFNSLYRALNSLEN